MVLLIVYKQRRTAQEAVKKLAQSAVLAQKYIVRQTPLCDAKLTKGRRAASSARRRQ